MTGTTRLVAADIGGTHARFCLASIGPDGAIALGEPTTLRTRDHASLAEAWRGFAEVAGEPMPQSAAVAVAAPASGEVIRFTNNPWVVDRRALGETLGVTRASVVNDFAAIGHAVARLGEANFRHLCGPDVPLPGEGTISVVGPGTGLGVAAVWRGSGDYRVQPTEGGHIAFAPADETDDRILARLRARFGRVSVERVISGPGLAEICAVLAEENGVPLPAMDDPTLWKLGLSGEDPLASAGVERFCSTLGAAAGDIVLAQGGTAAVIAGGLGLRLAERLTGSAFAASFSAKGRFDDLMATIPVKLVTHPQPGLFGAVAAFAKEHTA